MLRRCSLALALLTVAPAVLAAQYFGQNKVQYNRFDFQIIATEHFDVYFYPKERTAALDMARMAERSYARLSRILGHQFRERKPVILYASPTDFQQTNVSDIGEGTQGVTDFFKQRNTLALQGAYFENEHVLTHEMVHQFQYDVFSRGRAGAGLNTIIAVNPPLWFMEGMAEYLSLGPINPETAMWLRDAVLENKLPTIQQLETDPRIFPYRFGHALWSYIGQRWGDEAVGAILKGSVASGIPAAIRRTLGITVEQLSTQWRDAVQKQYLPEVGERLRARQVAKPLLTEERSQGTLHIAPALSPDGSEVAYFSEKDFFFVDLYLADGSTGKVKRRLLKSTFSSNYETFRFLNSQANWSPDGKYLAFAAKRGGTDDILILDVARNRTVGRITMKELNGVTTPSWSPDGQQLVFTGYDGGLSDLFIVNRDGSGLRRLTHDKFAELHPSWSPDGKTIAFATDRGPKTDFGKLTFNNFRIGLMDVASGQIRVLDHMDEGKNINPVWAPDGTSLAFVSDRNGVSNVFLYDLGDNRIYQLTDFFTGVSGFTPLSPVISWAPKADRLAFMYYEKGKYDVYTLDNPRALKRKPYVAPQPADTARALAQAPVPPTPAAPDTAGADSARADSARADTTRAADAGGSIYRSPGGFRSASELAPPGDTTFKLPEPVSVVALLDSASLALPDTSEFTIRKYSVKFSPDYIARPSIGYVHDNFGRGFFGGSAIELSDVLGDRRLLFAGYVNGRISEAQFLAAYANLARRLNWATGVSQDPYYFLEPSEVRVGEPTSSENTFVTNIRRLVIRSAFVTAAYPLSRFNRIEADMRIANVNDAILSILEPYDRASGFATRDPELVTTGLGSVNYAQPSLAYVHDNSVFGFTAPLFGSRYRLEAAQVLGDWKFSQFTVDYRRYDKIAGPVTFATRVLYFGRRGRDADQFLIFAGSTELIRGNTSGSYRRNECRNAADAGTQTGCFELDRLVGTQVAVASAELRFPIITPLQKWAPRGFPPIEGAFFYDVGLAWQAGNTLKWSRDPGDDPLSVRTPLQTIGASIRINLLGFVIARVDYSRPLKRPAVKSLWTISFGPAF
jgi:hypothetical protein